MMTGSRTASGHNFLRMWQKQLMFSGWLLAPRVRQKFRALNNTISLFVNACSVVVFLIASERVRHDAISGCLATRPVTRGPKPPLEKFSPLLEECVAHGLKILDIVQKIWTPLGKLFAPPGVLRWLRACLLPFQNYWRLSEKKIF